ncbi:MAG: STAS domain-containing protein [Bacillota bacterium]
MLETKVAEEQGVKHVALFGEIDMESVNILVSVTASKEETREVIVDLARVGFVDSTGLHALIGAARQTEEAGKNFRVINVPEEIQEILQLTGVEELIVKKNV